MCCGRRWRQNSVHLPFFDCRQGATTNTLFPIGELTWEISICSKRGAAVEGMPWEEVQLPCCRLHCNISCHSPCVPSQLSWVRRVIAATNRVGERVSRVSWLNRVGLHVLVTSSGICGVNFNQRWDEMGWVHLMRHFFWELRGWLFWQCPLFFFFQGEGFVRGWELLHASLYKGPSPCEIVRNNIS